MNVALLVKWIFGYGNEWDRLWRRVVCAKNEVDLGFLSIFFGGRGRRSILVNMVGSFLDRNDRVASLTRDSFMIQVGNGMNSDFWADNWTGLSELKGLFLRIVVLASIKEGSISLFGHWV